jgi:hypothetical protein
VAKSTTPRLDKFKLALLLFAVAAPAETQAGEALDARADLLGGN